MTGIQRISLWIPVILECHLTINRKGLISDQGGKKKAFYVMKKWYEGK